MFENWNALIEKKSKAKEWCEHNNSTLLKICQDGFYYTNANGNWYISYDEI